jgi:hypothetical protein
MVRKFARAHMTVSIPAQSVSVLLTCFDALIQRACGGLVFSL